MEVTSQTGADGVKPAYRGTTTPLAGLPTEKKWSILGRAARASLSKLNPFTLRGNPVVLLAESAAVLATILLLHELWIQGTVRSFPLQVTIWLWLTAFVANIPQALAKELVKARGEALRRDMSELLGKRICGRKLEIVAASKLQPDDVVVVSAGELIPVNGDIVEGIAMVDESAITGESAPVIREAGGALGAVTSGTRVISDEIKVRVISAPAETHLEKMISAVESANDERTKPEIRMQRFITVIGGMWVVVMTALFLYSRHRETAEGGHGSPEMILFVALLVCFIPITIGALLPAIGIAGVNRLVQRRILPGSRRVAESAGSVQTVFFDKTGTVTVGGREAVEFLPVGGTTERELAEVAYLSSLRDETPEGISVSRLAERLRGPQTHREEFDDIRVVPFSAFTRMSGVDVGERSLRKGASEAIGHYVRANGGSVSPDFRDVSERIARTGGTPLAVADGNRVLGLIHLKDSLKPALRDRLTTLRQLEIRSILMTGDNPITAAAIAGEVGIDDYLAQATPADKLAYIKKQQATGITAMMGDETNDAPALAQSDIGLVMNAGSASAKEAGNVVDLDSDPGKIVELIAVGRQIWVTRIALFVFSTAASFVQSVSVIPAMLKPIIPALAPLNLLHLRGQETGVLAATICNLCLILLCVPQALRGVPYRPETMTVFLRRTTAVYLAAGIVVPLPIIWLVDRVLLRLHLA